MNEIIKEWLREMYKDAISESEAAIANERIWQKGAETDAAIAMHEQNIQTLEEYIEVLEKKLESL